MALSADGSKLYVTLSGSNELGVINTTTNQLVDRIAVESTPQDVAIVGDEAFVSNRGGRPAVAGDTTSYTEGSASGSRSPIASSPVTGASTTGTVSVVNLGTNTVTDNINVGLQPASLTVHQGSVFVANTNSDTVSVIDAASHQVTQTFNVEPLPGSTVGAAPNSVTFANPHTLLVSVGRDNSIAVFGYNGPRTPVQYEGLIPTDAYPNEVQYDAKVGKVIVSNQEGISTDGADNTYLDKGTITSFTIPSDLRLGSLTSQVFDDNGWNNLNPSTPTSGLGNSQGEQNATGNGLPAIPTRLGQPSAIKHVFLIIKENRTYDELLGNIGKGNSDPNYSEVAPDNPPGVADSSDTPNQHSLANTFTLFDNFYDNGMLSADGHSWLLQADANDYLQQDAAGSWTRGYPVTGADALAYQRDGFIWNTVEAAGKTVKNYGEFESSSGGAGSWQQYYADSQILEGKASGPLPVALDAQQSSSNVPSLNSISDPDYPGFSLKFPDQYRVDIWQQQFQQQLKANSVPNLTIMALPDDHTGGEPVTTDAQAADNDLATGRVVSEISHSSIWKSSAVFVLEDDTQAGIDHVDGHRGPLFIASPYAQRGVINNEYYSQINVVKTIEQILGAQPMNQMDRAAVPMFDAFTNRPDNTPYNAVPNQIPLTQGATGLISLSPPAGSTDTAAQVASLAATTGPAVPAVPAAEQSAAAAWSGWYKTQAVPKLTGPNAVPDSVNPALLNRYDWYSTTDWSKPYPGDKTILAPDQVPGRNMPSDFLGD